MRLSANVLHSAEQRTNPLAEREIILRSLAVPSIEHLAVTRDQFDAIDLSNNHLTKLENFPKLNRLSSLYLAGNGIGGVDARNLKKNVPNLTTLILTGNAVKGWNVVADLGVGCPKLEFLSLVGNPVTSEFGHFSSSYALSMSWGCWICVRFQFGRRWLRSVCVTKKKHLNFAD